MKEKLKKFKEFASEILPHEAKYLCSIQQFEDDEKLDILNTIAYNCNQINRPKPFNEYIDKRKYSSLKNWIQKKLDEINVDLHFEWINEMDRRVMTDTLRPEDEHQIFRLLKNYPNSQFYFMKFYELVVNLRQFLLIRLRYKEHEIVHQFVENNRTAYLQSKEVSDQMHKASVDIINKYSLNNTESKHWEKWLLEVFYNEYLDGLNRYFAAIRLTFVYFNYREYDKIKNLNVRLDELLSEGVFYTRRILLNYYSNCLLLHSKFDILQQAEEYGYLSIKQKNEDHLKYLNNYSAILLRQGKIDKALSLMRQAMPEMRNTNNFHNKIGFTAFYMKCLCLNDQAADAERFGISFLRIYKQEVLEQRWHVFFGSFLQSMIKQEKFGEVLRTIRKYSILEKDQTFQSSVIYLPTIVWYEALSRYMEGKISAESLIQILTENSTQYATNPHKANLLQKLISELSSYVPNIMKAVKSNLLEREVIA
ncbi:hypothetical protein [Chondrinema litorale]|uniref:hypothetical protein n=1 Tax=Chondrinema litorale TaxID=2994555 RepID=UPI0025439046|nr:hypothetical protein [Chondrinema litorale]UZR97902.1 hypothetical protein OQ292_29240 [Chondrinema litorale]